ncbi:hypothetical protein [Stigmatella aurantiaca]|uniref:Carboxymethylenebutenolidase n=1 Tax=Stigmatella aurantiaca (strain DW4/3-1) TaxID=378806 RepID=Q08N50_STIAD|nr:hypothetical protein [Stigmatella aurantiaca]ADO72268.1 conserved uncharacterized protein [Stigmatella aurantiaca DW4/3-1]EAU61911.1 carboxymethylenebutenolidase [Stigmatella aurantiaca DW4/3-1]
MSELLASTDVEQLNVHEMASHWDDHLRSEFKAKSTEEAMGTMTDTPRVNIVPLMVGALNAEDLKVFYSKHFLNQLPPDIAIEPITRTAGQNRIVDEFVLKFTHSIQMDWILPGIPPTNRWIELAMVVIVQFDQHGDKIESENLYWDMGSIMLQAGLIDASLPVRGAEHARQALNPVMPMNELIARAKS